MIIFIFIFVFIIIIALIVLVISNGKGNSKDNKKFTFQYKHNKHNNHNYSSLFPYAPSVPNKQVPYTPSAPNKQVPYTPPAPNEQENRYTPSAPNEQENRYTPSAPNEQENRYTPSAPNEQENRYPPSAPPPPPPPKVPTEKVPTEKVPTEKVPISESNQKTESNIHNCEDNYIWNKYLNKCITTECPIETGTNCGWKEWFIPNSYPYKTWFMSNGAIPPAPIVIAGCTALLSDGIISPGYREQVCEYLNIPVPEEGQTCWSECQYKCVKPECIEMTMEECTTRVPGYAWNNSPIGVGAWSTGKTCQELSTLTPEFQLKLSTEFGDAAVEVVLPGEVCWSTACGKCVKPYVKPLTREQGRIKHNLNPTCFPNNKTCVRNTETGSQWSYSYLADIVAKGAVKQQVNVPNETCDAWSTFTNWGKYNLNPIVLPGEVCYNPCTGGCVAPINW